MVNKTQVGGIVGILILISLLGIQSFDNTYYCENRDILQECTRLSSTGKTCYTATSYKRCTDGIWISVEEIINNNTKVVYITEPQPITYNTVDGKVLTTGDCLIQGMYCYCNPRGLLQNKVKCKSLI